MSRSGFARASIGALIVLVAAACAPATGAGPSSTAPAASTSPPASVAASPAEGSADPSAQAGPTSYDTTSLGANFPLPMTVELPDRWMPLPPPDYGPIGAIGFVHTGDEIYDESQWWGFGLDLVDGASVIDPAEMKKTISSGNEASWLPWPASYTDYLAGLPGVEVTAGPERVTVAGESGTRITVTTPAMHPTIYLKGDFTWLGGGKDGVDPATKRQLIELTLSGKKVLIEYVDNPGTFDERVAEVNSIIASLKTKD